MVDFKVGDKVVYMQPYSPWFYAGVVKTKGKMYASIGSDTRIHLPNVRGVLHPDADGAKVAAELNDIKRDRNAEASAVAERYRARVEDALQRGAMGLG
jgi:hypothetical protein